MNESVRSFTYRRQRRNLTAGFDPVLSFAVGALLIFGTLLVYAATRNWYAAAGEDPQYYLKRHGINVLIGVALAFGTTFIDFYRQFHVSTILKDWRVIANRTLSNDLSALLLRLKVSPAVTIS